MLQDRKIKHKGQAMVEIALVLPIILLLLCGIIEFGRIFNTYIIVSNASREGARYSAIGHTDTEVIQLVKQKTPNLNIPESNITIYRETIGTAEKRVTVTVPCDLQLITPIIKDIISSTGTFKIQSSTLMRVE